MRKIVFRLYFLMTGLLFTAAGFSLPIQIIPEPVELQTRPGNFLLSKTQQVTIDPSAVSCSASIETYLETLRKETSLSLNRSAFNGTIVFRLNKLLFLPSRSEAYTIDVSKEKIVVEATDAAGMFYALQSLRQVRRGRAIPAMLLKDYPQYRYRGMHLDVSRHFFSADFVRKYIDLLARYKINVFHWHLTDSHGWRLESKIYPKLTSIGAWRAPRDGIPMTIALPTQPGEAATYGGYYTQEEVKAIIAYAKERFIDIIPEIEMPGHCTAALVAYPQYSTHNGAAPLLIPGGYAGDLMHNFCVGNDSSFLFLNNVLKEVMDLFPSTYIHIGGDEVRGEPWLRCDRCSSRMKTLGLISTKQLQAYFTARIDSFVTASGRKTIGWDEILEAGNLSKEAAVMSWRGIEGGIEGARKGHPVVMAPYRYVYFDFYQSAPELEPDITYAGLYLDSVYAFQPSPPLLTAEQAANIMGAQACLWTENIATEAHAEYMLLPRMLAFAEAVWSPAAKKNYRRFIQKTEHEFVYLDRQQLHYAKSLYNTGCIARHDTAAGNIEVKLTNQVAGLHDIRYTMDGEAPNGKSTRYTQPIKISKTGSVTSALFNAKGQQMGKAYRQDYSLHRGFGKPVSSNSAAAVRIPALSDGIFGSIEPYDGRWQFTEDSIWQIRLDLGVATELDSLRFRCLEDSVGNSFLPGKYSIAVSGNGNEFKTIQTVETGKIPQQQLRHIRQFSIPLAHEPARYILLTLERSALLPAAKTKPTLFIDEIELF